MQHFLTFGSHPLLSLAELKAVTSVETPLLLERMAVLDKDDWDGDFLQQRLAGTIKLGDVILDVPLADLTADILVETLETYPREGKIVFGLSFYGSSPKITALSRSLPIEVKRAWQSRGRKARWFRDDKGGVSPAAIAKLHLADEGYDINIGISAGHALVGLTTHVQDADAWSLRDYGRPFRDAKTGMLPPKLARLMVNLAFRPPDKGVGGLSVEPVTLLDPFCGSGTILMEAALLDQRAKIMGSDIDARQVAGAIENLDWMVEKKLISSERRASISCFTHPVETLDHQLMDQRIDAIVTEGFLGHPLQGNETRDRLARQVNEIETLWKKSLTVFAQLQSSGGTVVGVWPVFETKGSVVGVDLKKNLAKFGYQLLEPFPLVYGRPDQHVKRNIVVLKKI